MSDVCLLQKEIILILNIVELTRELSGYKIKLDELIKMFLSDRRNLSSVRLNFESNRLLGHNYYDSGVCGARVWGQTAFRLDNFKIQV